MKKLNTSLAEYEYEDNILLVKPHANYLIDASEMEAMLIESDEFVENQIRYVIVDTSNNFSSTADARKYYATSEHSKMRLADAMVVKSQALSILVNFYMKFNNPPIPTRMFDNVGDARAWINALKQSK